MALGNVSSSSDYGEATVALSPSVVYTLAGLAIIPKFAEISSFRPFVHLDTDGTAQVAYMMAWAAASQPTPVMHGQIEDGHDCGGPPIPTENAWFAWSLKFAQPRNGQYGNFVIGLAGQSRTTSRPCAKTTANFTKLKLGGSYLGNFFPGRLVNVCVVPNLSDAQDQTLRSNLLQYWVDALPAPFTPTWGRRLASDGTTGLGSG